MRIGLDATRVDFPTGEGVYVREVIQNLIGLCPEDHFVVVVPEQKEIFNSPNVEQYIYSEVDGLFSRLQYGFNAGKIAREKKLDVFHTMTNYVVFNAPCPIVINVMDLVTLKYPELRLNRLQGLVYKYIFPYFFGLADCIVAISNSTAHDMETYYGLSESVKTVQCGIDHSIFNTINTVNKHCLKRFSLPEKYLLFVGYLSPKKNLEIVLKAMQILKENGNCPKLVIVGKRGYGSESFYDLADEIDLRDQIIETGYVDIKELVSLYRCAGLFVFPSIYEGFGLPVVEAMACGTPVLVSDTGPLPEIVNDKRFLCNPDCANDWAAGIKTALYDDSHREWAYGYGQERANAYSWVQAAREIRNIYSALEKVGIAKGCRK